MRLIEGLLTALKSKLVIPSISILAIIVFASFGIYKATQATIVIAKDGEIETVKTHAKTVEDLFDTLDINVNEHDVLSEDLDTRLEDGMEIEYNKAKEIKLTVDGEFASYYTTAETVGQFLEEEYIEVIEHDDLSHELTDNIVEDIHIQLTNAYRLTILDGGEKRNVWTTGGTVEQLLEANDITLKKSDKIEPSIDEALTKGQNITITRITHEEEEVEEPIEFKTEKTKDNSLEKGKEKVVTEGKNGTLVKTYKLTLENGEEVKRELKEEKVKEKPTNKVIAIGTKKPQPKIVQKAAKKSTKQTKKAPTSNGKEFTMQATAYTADCKGCSGITATGINLKANPNRKVVAVDPNVIPLGSRVWVEGYGEAIAGDRGGSINGNRIDVHVPNRSAALSFGRRTVKVKILN